MKLERWFATPFWYDYTDLDVQDAANKCLALKEQGAPNRTLSNVGGWQSDSFFLNSVKEFVSVEAVIKEKLDFIAVSIGGSTKLILQDAWINISEKSSYNRPHVHPNSALSGVFYINTDEASGKIVFNNAHSSAARHYGDPFYYSDLFYNHITYTPKNGMLLVFPSWVEHEVEQNQSDIKRISISFNVKKG